MPRKHKNASERIYRIWTKKDIEKFMRKLKGEPNGRNNETSYRSKN